MNCKQGDLAIIVRSYQGNEGRIVRCLRFVPDFRWEKGGEPTWQIDVALNTVHSDARYFVADCQLRPIRDPGDDAKDETLNWLPAPMRDEVPA